ncbi:MAG: 2-oxoacid:ferredoxin oxidoreductase subunit beta [Chloroflexi bacterium]|nr:2-oxoacid:ferredoxin oxidoreductase subunit beta [Chloroflexota bacterium]
MRITEMALSETYVGNPLVEKYLRTKNVPTKTCTGCGIGIIENFVLNAMLELDLTHEDVVFAMGVGCTSRQVFATFKGDNVDALHGRAIPVVTAMKLVKPHLKFVVFTGDGDLAAIGNNHFVHAARRNVDMTVIMMNNMNYASTSGQHAPTTPMGMVLQTTPYGNDEPMYDVCGVAVAAGGTFVARHTVLQSRPTINSIKKAIQNVGFSFIEILMPCPTYLGRYALKSSDAVACLLWIKELARTGEYKTGVLHEATRAEFSDLKRQTIEKAQAGRSAEGPAVIMS